MVNVKQMDAQAAYHISIKSMAINLLLFLGKLLVGILIRSSSLISDGFHSLSDSFSTIVVMIGIKIANKPADDSHPYGHEKFESVIAFLLGMMLFGIALLIGWDGIVKVMHPIRVLVHNPLFHNAGIMIALLSIAGKEWMYRFTMRCAKKIGSSAMAADAWHHRSDALSSVGSLIGMIGLRLGYPRVDAVACLLISVFILAAAWEILSDACRRMVDTACPPEVTQLMRKQILSNEEVLSLDVLKTRMYGSKIYADVEITVDKNFTFEHSHDIARSVHDDIENTMDTIKHCMVHVNPSGLKQHHHI